jgi:RNA binding exosome subunit
MKNNEALSFSSVAISFFIHSTEDASRVIARVREALRLDKSELMEQRLTGYHGNEILSLNAHLIGDRANEIAFHLLSSIESNSRLRLKDDLESHLDEHDSFFIRLDKEGIASNGTLLLGEEEAIRIKLKPKHRSTSRAEMLEIYRKCLVNAGKEEIHTD